MSLSLGGYEKPGAEQPGFITAVYEMETDAVDQGAE